MAGIVLTGNRHSTPAGLRRYHLIWQQTSSTNGDNDYDHEQFHGVVNHSTTAEDNSPIVLGHHRYNLNTVLVTAVMRYSKNKERRSYGAGH